MYAEVVNIHCPLPRISVGSTPYGAAHSRYCLLEQIYMLKVDCIAVIY